MLAFLGQTLALFAFVYCSSARLCAMGGFRLVLIIFEPENPKFEQDPGQIQDRSTEIQDISGYMIYLNGIVRRSQTFLSQLVVLVTSAFEA